MIGQTVYALKEAHNWTQYCVKMTITRKQAVRFGGHVATLYVGHTSDGQYASSYWQDDRLGRLIRKKPWPDVPCFDTRMDEWAFKATNTLPHA